MKTIFQNLVWRYFQPELPIRIGSVPHPIVIQRLAVHLTAMGTSTIFRMQKQFRCRGRERWNFPIYQRRLFLIQTKFRPENIPAGWKKGKNFSPAFKKITSNAENICFRQSSQNAPFLKKRTKGRIPGCNLITKTRTKIRGNYRFRQKNREIRPEK